MSAHSSRYLAIWKTKAGGLLEPREFNQGDLGQPRENMSQEKKNVLMWAQLPVHLTA